MQKETISEWYNGVEYHNRWGSKYLTASNLVGKKHRRLHQQKWFDAYGEIPKGHHIHHKDENKFNNSLDNLECIPGGKHISDHMRKWVKENPEWMDRFQKAGIAKAPEWHASPEGIEWHKKNAASFNFGKFDYGDYACEQCGSIFNRKTLRSRFCGNSCKSAWRRSTRVDDIERTCKCGTQFMSDKYRGGKLCGACKTQSRIDNAHRMHASIRHKREKQTGVLRE